MKKIFYILASAIVALGAVACENEGLENINPNVGNGEGLSFVATIDAESRVALNGTVNSWELNDKVVINDYTFTCIDAENGIFSCTMDNVRKDLINKGTFTATYSYEGKGVVDSSVGAKGAVLTATGSFTETDGVVTANGFDFTLTSALLKFTTTEAVAFTGEGLFNNAAATYTGTNVCVAINAKDKATLSYAIGGTTCKTITMDFKAGKVYNLGTLTAPTDLAINGLSNHNGWDGVSMYQEGDYYYLRNVTIKSSDEFKLTQGGNWYGINNVSLPGDIQGMSLSGNDNIKCTKIPSGTYDIYVSKSGNKFTIFFCEPGTTEYLSYWGIVGTNNSWNVGAPTNVKHDFYKDIYVGDILFDQETPEFKISRTGSNWNSGNDYIRTGDRNKEYNKLTLNSAWNNLWSGNYGESWVLTSGAGTYTIEFKLSGNTYVKYTKFVAKAQ